MGRAKDGGVVEGVVVECDRKESRFGVAVETVAAGDEHATMGADCESHTPPWRLRSWLHHVLFGLILRRAVHEASKDGRHIPLRLAEEGARPPHLVDDRRGLGYLSNAIRTSRYTVLTFLPKQLIFQFSRISNVFFLCVGIPQTIPGISTTGSFTTILPLLFFVLLTIAKEGYDDYKRHRLDTVENAGLTTVLRRVGHAHQIERRQRWHDTVLSWCRWPLLRARRQRHHQGKGPVTAQAGRVLGAVEGDACLGLCWMHIQWRDIRVGDVVKLSRDEDVPADLMLLHAAGEGGLAYVETMALDGETNLKSRQVPAPLAQGRCSTIGALANCPIDCVVEDPNPDLYRFDGRITVDGETLPLTLAHIVHRGSTLRNTPGALGLVINTGEECKSRLNANRNPRAKKPALERVTNTIVLILAVYVILLAAGLSIGYYIWQQGTEASSWYISSVAVPAEEIILGFVIQFNNVIPLALYISLEIVKIGQMFFVNSDIAMYDEVSDTPARCNTNTILENLGQIGFVFSDKTGTLTENVMKFRKMSVAGTSWLHEADIGQKAASDAEGLYRAPVNSHPQLRHSADISPTPHAMTHSVAVSPMPVDAESQHGRVSVESASAVGSPTMLSPQANRRSSSHWRSTGRPDHAQPELTTEDLLEYVRRRPHALFSRRVVTYILAMALCHTCLPEREEGEVVGFQASSPDELALVRAAEELGFLVIQKSSTSTTLRLTYNDADHPTEEVYDVVDVLEFSSQRKRMSVIVRRPDGRLWLICKGADSVILPRLRMAPLAMQRARDVRKSAELERELLRKSEQFEPRSSVTIRKSIGGSAHRDKVLDKPGNGNSIAISTAVAGSALGSVRRPTTGPRSQSFDVPKPSRRSADALRLLPAALNRSSSVDIHSSAQGPRHHQNALPDKFAFLETASFMAEDDSSIFDQCFRHIDDFATEGLRTLLFAHKFMPDEEYAAWKADFLAAATSLTERQDRIEAVAERIEQNLDLIGASAIEDRLQKGVPETIDKLRRANIKVWMLTGDKRETAINIAHSARLCRPSSDVYIVDASKGDLAGQMLHIAESMGLPDVVGRPTMVGRAVRILRRLATRPFSLGQALPSVRQQQSHTVVVVDGHTLGVIEQDKHKAKQATHGGPLSVASADPDLRRLFYRIIPTVDSVVCCRASPAQKALLVRSIRHGASGGLGQGRHPGLTLAIGDGANDLAMLAEAHVGIGVSGKEGLQAARVADYSIAQFRFLARLLLVHGRWNYVRTAQFILATFYKEMFFYTPAAAYQWFCGYTGTSIYENWSLTVLNTLFTSLCVIIPGICEQDLSASMLMEVPELYAYGQRGHGLNPKKYVSWMAAALAQGVLVWFACWAGFGRLQYGQDPGLFALGDLIFSVCIMWTNWKLL